MRASLWSTGGAARGAHPRDEAVLARGGAGTEGHRFVLPGGIERLEIERIGIWLLQQRREILCLRLCGRERGEGAEGRLVGRAALAQPLREGGKNMCRLAECRAGLGRRPARQELEKQRQEVR